MVLSESELLACCGSKEWARRMAAAQPFRGVEQMLEASDRIWWELTAADWLEAFAAHPRIGQRSSDRHAAGEQSGVQIADEATLARLAAGNRAYEEKFGYIYIVRASGRSAAEMLDILEARLGNDGATELRVAAEQQRQISRLRLDRLVGRT